MKTWLVIIAGLLCALPLMAESELSVYGDETVDPVCFILRNDTCVIIEPHPTKLLKRNEWPILTTCKVKTIQNTGDFRLLSLSSFCYPMHSGYYDNVIVDCDSVATTGNDSIVVNLHFPNLINPQLYPGYNSGKMKLLVYAGDSKPEFLSDGNATVTASRESCINDNWILVCITPLLEYPLNRLGKFDGLACYALPIEVCNNGHPVTVTFSNMTIGVIRSYYFKSENVYIQNDTLVWNGLRLKRSTVKTSDYELFLDTSH